MGNAGNPQLHLDYDRETDTLGLGNGRPTPNGEDIAEAVVVFFDDADRPNAVAIDHAAELLLPLLTAARQEGKTGKDGNSAQEGNSAHPAQEGKPAQDGNSGPPAGPVKNAAATP